jgi:hypothetical protein
MVRRELRPLVSPPVGVMTIKRPMASSSSTASGLAWHIRSNCSGVSRRSGGSRSGEGLLCLLPWLCWRLRALAMQIGGDGGGHGRFIQPAAQEAVETGGRAAGVGDGLVVRDGEHLHRLASGLQQGLEPLNLLQVRGSQLALVAGRGALAVAFQHGRLGSEHLA